MHNYMVQIFPTSEIPQNHWILSSAFMSMLADVLPPLALNLMPKRRYDPPPVDGCRKPQGGLEGLSPSICSDQILFIREQEFSNVSPYNGEGRSTGVSPPHVLSGYASHIAIHRGRSAMQICTRSGPLLIHPRSTVSFRKVFPPKKKRPSVRTIVSSVKSAENEDPGIVRCRACCKIGLRVLSWEQTYAAHWQCVNDVCACSQTLKCLIARSFARHTLQVTGVGLVPHSSAYAVVSCATCGVRRNTPPGDLSDRDCATTSSSLLICVEKSRCEIIRPIAYGHGRLGIRSRANNSQSGSVAPIERILRLFQLMHHSQLLARSLHARTSNVTKCIPRSPLTPRGMKPGFHASLSKCIARIGTAITETGCGETFRVETATLWYEGFPS